MEFYDIREIENVSLTLILEDGRVERPRIHIDRSKAFRVLKNGFWGYFSGNVDDSEGLKLAAENCVFESDSAVYVDDADKTSPRDYFFKEKIKLEDIHFEEKVEILRDIEGEMNADFVVNTRVAYMEIIRRFHYRNSSGVEVYYEVPRSGVVAQAVGKGKTLQFYSKRYMRAGGFEVAKEAAEGKKIGSHILEVLKELINASPPPSGKMNVLMDSSLGGVFIHEAFGHAVEADHILQGASIVAGRIGQKVGAEGVNVYDDPSIEEFGFFPFDDEGIQANRKAIIENGVLKSYLHSRETAAKLNGQPGNARAQGVDVPIVRMSNTFINEGELSLEELLAEMKEGVYLIGSRGGETNPATGYFHFNAQYGFMVRKGEIQEMIRDVSISGNTLEILHSMKVGRGLEFNPGFCGKAGQLVPVSDGAPPTLVKALVGGM
jgi:TldD protein